MSKNICHKLVKTMTLTGSLGVPTVMAHGGIDAGSGFFSLTAHGWLHAAQGVPLALLATVLACAAAWSAAARRRGANGEGPE